MLRITMSDSPQGVAKYFDAALATSDYYQKDQGMWSGKAAEMLGQRPVKCLDTGLLIHPEHHGVVWCSM